MANRMATSKLNILILGGFLFLAFMGGIVKDFVSVVIGGEEISLENILVFRGVTLACSLLCFYLAKTGQAITHSKLYSICVICYGLLMIVFAPENELNGTIVYVFGIMLFLDSFSLWRNKKALFTLALFSILLLIGQAELKSIEASTAIMNGFLNIYIAVTFYTNFYRNKVGYFEKD